MNKQQSNTSFKQKLFKEFSEYLVNFAYMSIVFSAIILYRRVVLSAHGIVLEDYFMGVIKAFVIAKVVMLAAFIKTSRHFENKPLVIPVIYKSLYFTLTVMAFDVIEEFTRAIIHYMNFYEAIVEVFNHMNKVWLTGSMLIFFIFIPFFAARELVRVMGKEKMQTIFFKSTQE